jgi:hypothetical protein
LPAIALVVEEVPPVGPGFPEQDIVPAIPVDVARARDGVAGIPPHTWLADECLTRTVTEQPRSELRGEAVAAAEYQMSPAGIFACIVIEIGTRDLDVGARCAHEEIVESIAVEVARTGCGQTEGASAVTDLVAEAGMSQRLLAAVHDESLAAIAAVVGCEVAQLVFDERRDRLCCSGSRTRDAGEDYARLRARSDGAAEDEPDSARECGRPRPVRRWPAKVDPEDRYAAPGVPPPEFAMVGFEGC